MSTLPRRSLVESEFEKYRVIQDREYRSDFDEAMSLFLLDGGSSDDETGAAEG